MNLNNYITDFLKEKYGANLVGFADVEGLAPQGYKYAVVAAVALTPDILDGIPVGPLPDYLAQYKSYNLRLDEMAVALDEHLNTMGYRTMALCRENCPWDRVKMSTEFPYKTSATRAGLGWVGKCALLVTPEYGSAVRLTVVLTDAPVTPNQPITESRCGNCTKCVEACPAGAVQGNNWYPGIERPLLVDIPRCDQVARDLAEVTLGYRTTMCGRCFAACPYTQAYMKKARL